MKRAWHPEESVEHWTIVPGEWPLIEHKHGATRLGFAVLLKCSQYAGAFPWAPQDVPRPVVDLSRSKSACPLTCGRSMPGTGGPSSITGRKFGSTAASVKPRSPMAKRWSPGSVLT